MHLVDRLIERDELALIELMNRYGDYLYRTAFLLVRDHQTAEEAVQDTFITAYEKITQLEDLEKLKSWLTTIVINRCRSQMRKWNWKNILLHFETSSRFIEDETAKSPEDELLNAVWNQKLSSSIQKLDYKYREVITLFYFNEMKITEISQQTKTKESTIKSRLTRGRLLLKAILEEGEVNVESEKSSNKGTAR